MSMCSQWTAWQHSLPKSYSQTSITPRLPTSPRVSPLPKNRNTERPLVVPNSCLRWELIALQEQNGAEAHEEQWPQAVHPIRRRSAPQRGRGRGRGREREGAWPPCRYSGSNRHFLLSYFWMKLWDVDSGNVQPAASLCVCVWVVLASNATFYFEV